LCDSLERRSGCGKEGILSQNTENSRKLSYSKIGTIVEVQRNRKDNRI